MICSSSSGRVEVYPLLPRQAARPQFCLDNQVLIEAWDDEVVVPPDERRTPSP